MKIAAHVLNPFLDAHAAGYLTTEKRTGRDGRNADRVLHAPTRDVVRQKKEAKHE